MSDAKVLIEKHQGLLIKKIRYVVPRQDGRHWELDVFDGDHDGLCIAEVEFEADAEGRVEIDHPDWLGREVTGEARYYNASLSQEGWPPRHERRQD